MSNKELARHQVLGGVLEGQLAFRDAAVALGVSPRHARRLLRRLLEHGPQGLVHGNRGRPPVNRTPDRREWPVIEVAGWLHAAARRWGSGRIVVLGEAAMCTSQGEGDSRMGMNAPGAEQNAQFCLNVVHWLTGLLD